MPSGTVTFLFTDLDGSTRLWEQHPGAMKAALARHDEILREAIGLRDGHVVKTTGDGFHAVFTTAHDAIGATAAAQRVLTSQQWARRRPTCSLAPRRRDVYSTRRHEGAAEGQSR